MSFRIAILAIAFPRIGHAAPFEGWNCSAEDKWGSTPVCIVNASKSSSQSLVLHYPKGIIVVSGALIYSQQIISLTAGGSIYVRQSAQLIASRIVVDASSSNISKVSFGGGAAVQARKGDVVLVAAGFKVVNASVTASSSVTLSGQRDPGGSVVSCTQGLLLEGQSGTPVLAAGSKISLSCPDGRVNIKQKANVTLTGSFGMGQVYIESDDLNIDTQASIGAAQILVKAYGDVSFIATTIPGTKSFRTNLTISTPKALILGAGVDHVTWRLSRLFVAAATVVIQGNIGTGFSDVNNAFNTCYNERSSREDVCIRMLSSWTGDAEGAANTAAAAVKGKSQISNMSFDMAVIANQEVTIIEQVQMTASSLLVCANKQASLRKGVKLDTSGGGCPPGAGIGHGETRDPSYGCGAGGASHVGLGGMGAKYDSAVLTTCAVSLAPYDFLDELLPTQGASGGGCGVPQQLCDKMDSQDQVPKSAGGGLIWLSASNLEFNDSVSLKADGTPGKRVAYRDLSMVSGGGAGGQILLFASGLDAPPPEKPEKATSFSAKGGAAFCSQTMIGGGGGGGFVGLSWNQGTFHTRISDRINLPIVSGGSLSDECKQVAPLAKRNWADVLGKEGRAATLMPCTAGHSGFLCAECPKGKYSSTGMSDCAECHNKPPNGYWTDVVGWNNTECPYTCPPGYPNVIRNPYCLNAFEYVITFFGGATSVAVILICFALVAAFVLCWHSHRKKHRRSGGLDTSFDCDSTWAQSRRRCRPGAQRSQISDTGRQSTLKFTKEKLPYHLCRVYLSGQNTPTCPWSIDEQIPTAQLESVILENSWRQMVAALNATAAIGRRAKCVETVLTLYPPVATIYARMQRRYRARKLRSIVRRFSNGSWRDASSLTQPCYRSLWNPLRQPSGTPENLSSWGSHREALAAVFGSDPGSTLGYIDFFDRSQYDFAPVDLKREALVLVARGHGSYGEPYALDVDDPLVEHLSQTDFGRENVCALICSFNRIARLLNNSDLQTSSPMVQRLRHGVERIALRCARAGSVHVLALQIRGPDTSAKKNGHLDSSGSATVTDTSFSDLLPNGQRLVGIADRSAFPTVPHLDNTSYNGARDTAQPAITPPGQRKNDIIFAEATSEGGGVPKNRGGNRERSYGASNPRGSPSRSSSTQNINSTTGNVLPPSLAQSQTSNSGSTRGAEVKLCLAFTDCSSSTNSRVGVGQAPASRGCGFLEAALTAPMAQDRLVEQILAVRTDEAIHVTSPPNAKCHPSWCLTFSWRDSAGGTPNIVLFVLIILIFLDLMCWSLASVMFEGLSRDIFLCWIFVPPFSHIIGFALGPTFVLVESPWIGRILAAFQLCAAMSAVITGTFLTAVLKEESWFFDLLQMLTILAVKVSMFVVVHLHIGNLEAAQDLSFGKASQADFLGRLLSGGEGMDEERRQTFETQESVGSPDNSIGSVRGTESSKSSTPPPCSGVGSTTPLMSQFPAPHMPTQSEPTPF